VLAHEAAKQLEEEDIDVEVIDLRSIPPHRLGADRRIGQQDLSLHWWLKRCWRLMALHAEIAAGVQGAVFRRPLDATLRRLGGAQVPMPYSLPLEKGLDPDQRGHQANGQVGGGEKNRCLT